MIDTHCVMLLLVMVVSGYAKTLPLAPHVTPNYCKLSPYQIYKCQVIEPEKVSNCPIY